METITIRAFWTWLGMIVLCLHAAAVQDNPMDIAVRLVRQNNLPYLTLTVDDEEVIRPGITPLYGESDCTVEVKLEAIPEGCLLHYTVVNQTDKPVKTPAMTVGGIAMPRDGSRIIETWQNVRFQDVKGSQSTRLPGRRIYPAMTYAPVTGVHHGDLFVGSALMYKLLEMQIDITVDYDYREQDGTWTLIYNTAVAAKNYTEVPGPVTLAAGETYRFTLSVGVARPTAWVTAYRPYRDFFSATYGGTSYYKSVEPIYAQAASVGTLLSDNNPRGFTRGSAGDGEGRLDEEGWTGFPEYVKKQVMDRGFRRMMIWNVTGLYRKHRGASMTWEIGSEWTEEMLATKDEFSKAAELVEMGLWWGRATAVSGGFDTGRRHAVNPDNPKDMQACYRELDPLYRMGVRLIGLDATHRGAYPGMKGWTPSGITVYREWLPKLKQRYPGMRFLIEPAAPDFLHTLAYAWSRAPLCPGPRTFADYILPGQVSCVAIRRKGRNRASMSEETIHRYIKWGYTLVVFWTGMYPVSVDREIIEEKQQEIDRLMKTLGKKKPRATE
ncbi:MAG: hypothetical protein K9N51_00415 [Candidatus Pacebacteria bacterium]|nr:hypothetical protein [Candidatus Paceibacterota bacterium]